MTRAQAIVKRIFDVIVALSLLLLTAPLILIVSALSRLDTKATGIFTQVRIGRYGKPFTVYKIRTMRDVHGTSVTTRGDTRITKMGSALRRFKIDELPQLWNVLIGDMSLVGPRPDVPGFADQLDDEDKVILELRPGITGPASIKYKNEEEILARVEDSEHHNQHFIWPDKIRINREYFHNYSLSKDIEYIFKTVFS